jgi:hypothetical protein
MSTDLSSSVQMAHEVGREAGTVGGLSDEWVYIIND